MMHVERFVLGYVATNTYLLYENKSKEAVIIDPSHEPEDLLKRVEELGLKVHTIFLTHAHFDHIGGLEIVRKVTGANVMVHEKEQDWLEDATQNGSALFPMIPKTICQPAETILNGKETFTWFGRDFQVIHTPGHSPGSVSLLTAGLIFGGDVLFARSIGRTDLPGGDHTTLLTSIHQHFFTLPNSTIVYPGHGDQTTIGVEKRENPFL